LTIIVFFSDENGATVQLSPSMHKPSAVNNFSKQREMRCDSRGVYSLNIRGDGQFI